MVTAFQQYEGVVGHTVHAATAVHGVGHFGGGGDGSAGPIGLVFVAQLHIAADVSIAFNGFGVASGGNHGTLVATAVHSADLPMQQDDVGYDVQVAFVVAAKDDIHMVAVGFLFVLDIEKHGDAMAYGDAVTTAVDGTDMTGIVSSIDMNINKSVGLNRFKIGVTILSI